MTVAVTAILAGDRRRLGHRFYQVIDHLGPPTAYALPPAAALLALLIAVRPTRTVVPASPTAEVRQPGTSRSRLG